MSKLTIIPVGTKVGLVEDVVGTVRSVTIHGNESVAYEVGWWSGRSFTTDHFYESELNPQVGTRQQIGFNR